MFPFKYLIPLNNFIISKFQANNSPDNVLRINQKNQVINIPDFNNEFYLSYNNILQNTKLIDYFQIIRPKKLSIEHIPINIWSDICFLAEVFDFSFQIINDNILRFQNIKQQNFSSSLYSEYKDPYFEEVETPTPMGALFSINNLKVMMLSIFQMPLNIARKQVTINFINDSTFLNEFHITDSKETIEKLLCYYSQKFVDRNINIKRAVSQLF